MPCSLISLWVEQFLQLKQMAWVLSVSAVLSFNINYTWNAKEIYVWKHIKPRKQTRMIIQKVFTVLAHSLILYSDMRRGELRFRRKQNINTWRTQDIFIFNFFFQILDQVSYLFNLFFVKIHPNCFWFQQVLTASLSELIVNFIFFSIISGKNRKPFRLTLSFNWVDS